MRATSVAPWWSIWCCRACHSRGAMVVNLVLPCVPLRWRQGGQYGGSMRATPVSPWWSCRLCDPNFSELHNFGNKPPAPTVGEGPIFSRSPTPLCALPHFYPTFTPLLPHFRVTRYARHAHVLRVARHPGVQPIQKLPNHVIFGLMAKTRTPFLPHFGITRYWRDCHVSRETSPPTPGKRFISLIF